MIFQVKANPIDPLILPYLGFLLKRCGKNDLEFGKVKVKKDNLFIFSREHTFV